MKIVTSSNGKKRIKLSKSEWATIGRRSGWMSKLAEEDIEMYWDADSRKYISKEEDKNWKPREERPKTWEPEGDEEVFVKKRIESVPEFIKYIRKTGVSPSYFASRKEHVLPYLNMLMERFNIFAYSLNGKFFAIGFFNGETFTECIICQEKIPFFKERYGVEMGSKGKLGWGAIEDKSIEV